MGVDGKDQRARMVGEARDLSPHSFLRPEWEKERRSRRATACSWRRSAPQPQLSVGLRKAVAGYR